ncbi:MAG TPA: helix-turn-helix domain-containing protein [Candidatus Mediterraneibacter merdipullorum]|nr:helix-turn-helix domain-containing protein [Candidatus Mediterraneibacter merdipullorum]
MALSDKIKEYREARHMTQQLADRLYVSRQTVCRWENGTRCPDLIMAKQLASSWESAFRCGCLQ